MSNVLNVNNRPIATMKLNVLLYAILFAFSSSCVEVYQFPHEESDKMLVVQGTISDVSYEDTQTLRMLPRYFDVELKYSSPVINVRDELVSNASVQLVDDLDEHWDYSEVEPGIYRLFFEDFKVDLNRQYKIEIELENGDTYESAFAQATPTVVECGTSMTEVEREEFDRIAGKWKIRIVKGVEVYAEIQAVDDAQDIIYHKWDFLTTYAFIARLNGNLANPFRTCYITSIYENPEIAIATSKGQGRKKLFFLSTNNLKIYDGYSTLIRQQFLTKDQYQFWYDLEVQQEQSNLFAPPPYNLPTNLVATNSEKRVVGYFGVVREKYYRWDFDLSTLSYHLPYPDALRNSCDEDPGPQCFNCAQKDLAPKDINNTERPWWWEL